MPCVFFVLWHLMPFSAMQVCCAKQWSTTHCRLHSSVVNDTWGFVGAKMGACDWARQGAQLSKEEETTAMDAPRTLRCNATSWNAHYSGAQLNRHWRGAQILLLFIFLSAPQVATTMHQMIFNEKRYLKGAHEFTQIHNLTRTSRFSQVSENLFRDVQMLAQVHRGTKECMSNNLFVDNLFLRWTAKRYEVQCTCCTCICTCIWYVHITK